MQFTVKYKYISISIYKIAVSVHFLDIRGAETSHFIKLEFV